MKKYSGVELIYGSYKWYNNNQKDTFDIIWIISALRVQNQEVIEEIRTSIVAFSSGYKAQLSLLKKYQ